MRTEASARAQQQCGLGNATVFSPVRANVRAYQERVLPCVHIGLQLSGGATTAVSAFCLMTANSTALLPTARGIQTIHHTHTPC